MPPSEAGSRLVHHRLSKNAVPRLSVLGAALAVASTLGSQSAPAQSDNGSSALSRITARSYVAIDADSGTLLLARRPTARRPIASLTKGMTGLLTIGHRHFRPRADAT